MTDKTHKTTAEINEADKRQAALNKGYALASKQLRDNHRDEFNALRVNATKALGYEWTPEPTAEEKAAAEVAELLAKFPSIADKIQALQPQDEVGPQTDDSDDAYDKE